MKLFFFAISLVVIPLSQLDFAHGAPAATRECEYIIKRQKVEEANELYEAVYPCYMEICGSTQWARPGQDGGYFGHAFGLMTCACRGKDGATGVAQITKCEKGNSVGISTDPLYNNVNWTAVKGREFTMYGRPDSGALTQAKSEEMMKRAEADGILDGVELASVNSNKDCKDDLCKKNWALKEMIGTDFGLTTARRVTCTRVPLEGSKDGAQGGALTDVMSIFNDLNTKAHKQAHPTDGSKPLYYERLYEAEVNNCTHPHVNALARVGLVQPRFTDNHPQSMSEAIKRRGDAADPFGSMLEAYNRGNKFDIKHIESWLGTAEGKQSFFGKAFFERGFIGAQPGVIMEDIPAQLQDENNPVFKIHDEQKLFSMVREGIKKYGKKYGINLSDRSKHLEKTLADSAGPGVNLEANLKKWIKEYESALKRLNTGLFVKPEVREPLKKYVSEKLVETKKKLEIVKNFKPKVRVEGYDKCMSAMQGQSAPQ